MHFARKLHKLLRTGTFSLFNSQIIRSLSWRVVKLRQFSEEIEISLLLSEAWQDIETRSVFHLQPGLSYTFGIVFNLRLVSYSVHVLP